MQLHHDEEERLIELGNKPVRYWTAAQRRGAFLLLKATFDRRERSHTDDLDSPASENWPTHAS